MTAPIKDKKSTLIEALTKSSRHIAVIRTIAPLLWSALVVWLGNRSFDLTGRLADGFGVSDALVDSLAPLVISFILWVAAVWLPSDLFEKIILFVKVDNYAYGRDDEVITESGHIRNEDILVLEPGATDEEVSDVVTRKLIERRPDVDVASAAARMLHDYINEQAS